MNQRDYDKFGGFKDKFSSIFLKTKYKTYRKPIEVNENLIPLTIKFSFENEIFLANYTPNFMQ